MASNAALGKLILAATFSAFFYYVFWVAVLPFIVIDARDESWIYSLFPPMKFAFLVPALFGVVLLGGLSAFSLYHLRDHLGIRFIRPQ
uniref:Dolichol phosphate-mannose biosynthesis regulatory protein n=1 Tax=Anopheles christyi TaxID=43041 RepID=A0A182K931_9DIPT